MAQDSSFDCIVIGGGPTGLAAAAGVSRLGMRVAVVDDMAWRLLVPEEEADRSSVQDLKTAALFPPSVEMLRNLGAWEKVEGVSEPMSAIRLVDDTSGLLRAPEVLFHARDLGLASLAHNVPNTELTRSLARVARDSGAHLLRHGKAQSISVGSADCTVELADGTVIRGAFLIGSDGRQSLTRSAAGIRVNTWTYDQSALITMLHHSRGHRGISTELHGSAGPCTTVPLPGLNSSLVWVDRPDFIARQLAASTADFTAALASRLRGLLGEIVADGPRRSFPMSGLLAERMAKGRVALVGEAGHALPPIGAQGLNLGLADVAVLIDAIANCVRRPSAVGIEFALSEYADRRGLDIRRRAGAVDLLNRTLESGSAALRLVRGAGLHVLAALPGMRRMLMARGLEPPDPLPELMRAPPLRNAGRHAGGNGGAGTR